MKKFQLLTLSAATLLLAIAGCKEDAADYHKDADAQAHFTNVTTASVYFQNTSNSVYKLPVGVTSISDKDRTVTYSVTSTTGAAAGAQYTIANLGKVVIPAGEAIGYIPVTGIYAGNTARFDTLVFTLTGGDIPATDYNKTLTLAMRYCNIDVSTLVGDYLNTRNTSTGTPYKSTVNSVTTTSATTGYLMISGIYVTTAAPVRVNLDWTDIGNLKTQVVTTANVYNDATYGPVQYNPIGFGSFNPCANTITLSFQRQVAAGVFANNIVTMAR
jgi:hypothetical protein